MKWQWIPALLIASILSAGPSMNGFDLGSLTIPRKEVVSGGPARDGIPSIDTPVFETASVAATWLKDGDRALSITLNEKTRAYPLRVLVWHEIVNDRFAGQPVLVSYCLLCGTAMAFDARVNGRELTFGVSGLLYQSDVLMYDRETESLWSQLGMEAVSGSYARTELRLLNSQLMDWVVWKERYPDGEVLSRETGYRRNYSRNPYAGYAETDKLLFPVPDVRRELPRKHWVAGIHSNRKPMAFPVDELARRAPVEIEVNKRKLRVLNDDGVISVIDRDSGEELPVTQAYWFAWQAFNPDTLLWREHL